MKGITENLEGLQFGEWTIGEKLDRKSGGHYVYKCIHISGYIREMASNDIKKGELDRTRAIKKNNNIKSKTKSKNIRKRNFKGVYNFTDENSKLIRKKLNVVYWCMRQRCENHLHKSYKNYGGRGIKVCDEWLDKENSFNNFYEWAINNGYEEGLTLDRIDVNGNYSPENCKWSTWKEQQNNRRNNIYIKINNTTLTLQQWADKLNITRDKLLYYYEQSYSICVNYINKLLPS